MDIEDKWLIKTLKKAINQSIGPWFGGGVSPKESVQRKLLNTSLYKSTVYGRLQTCWLKTWKRGRETGRNIITGALAYELLLEKDKEIDQLKERIAHLEMRIMQQKLKGRA